MKQVISLSYGEVALKGGNRKYFVDKLMKNLKQSLRGYATIRIGRNFISSVPLKLQTRCMNKHGRFLGLLFQAVRLSMRKTRKSLRSKPLNMCLQSWKKIRRFEALNLKRSEMTRNFL